jgi:DNA-binding MarR family transcriptional regulator
VLDDPTLPPLDLASAVTLLGDAVSRTVVEALAGTGLRHGHGYLVQRLLVGPSTATEIAAELGITQQAVSKAVQELLALGHLEPTTDPTDRRRRPVQLSARGRRAVEAARQARRAVDDRLRAALGDETFDATLVALTTALEALGLGDRVRRRAVPPPGPTLG